jgi:hypothetical protein
VRHAAGRAYGGQDLLAAPRGDGITVLAPAADHKGALGSGLLDVPIVLGSDRLDRAP